ncbi:hypothetical protein B0T10DRAFT_586429 [Thelonectria olida]|uniref:Uncharacterized protein n=1 Tax=Thelonectria olida TaxID=1576542 RepID=A0A9P8VS08_9HYPO|nr:hypothetical protein B0T10DRAFT_586429 [Thelonectria olida]
MFRDETTRTRNRFHHWNTRTRGSDSTSASNAPLSLALITPAYRLAPSAEDAAICHFYQTIIDTLSDEDPAYYLHTQLPSLYARSDLGSALRLATEAISYAVSVKLVREATLLSRIRYVRAIQAIGKAIQDPREARNDETLYAILLLCGYETILQNQNTPPAWGAHVDGAAALVKFRGTSEVHTPLSRSMFSFVRKSVVLGHMQICRPVDKIFTVPGATTSLHESPEDHLISTAAKIPNLQYRSNCLFNKPQEASENDTETLFSSAMALDRELSDWASNIPTTWSYSAAINVSDPATSKFTSGQVHRYPNFYIARVWNFYRVSRLVIQSVLVRAISRLPMLTETHTKKEYRKSKIEGSSMELVNDICASVPFLLGHDLSKMKLPATSGRTKQETSWPGVEENGATRTGRFSLIWPLYVACSASSVPEAQREWMHMQLRFLAENGESQAHVVCLTKSQTLLGGAENFRFDCV